MRECRSKENGEFYAVKIFRSEDEEMYIHAEREFKIMKQLEGNPNIVRGVEYISEFHKSRGYIVMEKITGETILNLVLD